MKRFLAVFLVVLLCFNNFSCATSIFDSAAVQGMLSISPEDADGIIIEGSGGQVIETLGEDQTEEERPSGGILFILELIEWFLNYIMALLARVINFIIPSITGIVYGTNKMFQLSFFNEVGKTSNSLFSAGSSIWGRTSVAEDVTEYISQFYYLFNYVALIIFVVIIAYLAVRMILSSLGRQKAFYKMLLKNWFVALLILCSGPFIMAYTIWLSNTITTLIYNTAYTLYAETTYPELEAEGWGTEVEANIHDIIPQTILGSTGSTGLVAGPLAKGAVKLAENFLKFVLGVKLVATIFTLVGLLFYLGIVILVMWTYLKRLLYVAFLIIIFPIICITYVFDMIGDRKAQSFNRWFHEFAGAVFIQPFHALILTLLLGIFTTAIWIFVMPVLGTILACFLLTFLFKGEDLFKNLFQIQTNTSFGNTKQSLLNGLATAKNLADMVGQGRELLAREGNAKENYDNLLEDHGLQKDKKGMIDKNQDNWKKLNDDQKNALETAEKNWQRAKKNSSRFAINTGGVGGFVTGLTGGNVSQGLMWANSISKMQADGQRYKDAKEVDEDFDKLEEDIKDYEDIMNKKEEDRTVEDEEKIENIERKLGKYGYTPEMIKHMSSAKRKSLVAQYRNAEKAGVMFGDKEYKARIDQINNNNSASTINLDETYVDAGGVEHQRYSWATNKEGTIIRNNETGEYVAWDLTNGDGVTRDEDMKWQEIHAGSDAKARVYEQRAITQLEADGIQRYATDNKGNLKKNADGSYIETPDYKKKYKEYVSKYKKEEQTALKNFTNLQIPSMVSKQATVELTTLNNVSQLESQNLAASGVNASMIRESLNNMGFDRLDLADVTNGEITMLLTPEEQEQLLNELVNVRSNHQAEAQILTSTQAARAQSEPQGYSVKAKVSSSALSTIKNNFNPNDTLSITVTSSGEAVVYSLTDPDMSRCVTVDLSGAELYSAPGQMAQFSGYINADGNLVMSDNYFTASSVNPNSETASSEANDVVWAPIGEKYVENGHVIPEDATDIIRFEDKLYYTTSSGKLKIQDNLPYVSRMQQVVLDSSGKVQEVVTPNSKTIASLQQKMTIQRNRERYATSTQQPEVYTSALDSINKTMSVSKKADVFKKSK